MSTAPAASVRRQAAARRIGDDRVWWTALVAGLLLCAAYAAIPPRHVFLSDGVFYTATEVAAIAALVLGVRWYRPAASQAWLLIGGGLVAFAIGDVLFTTYKLTGREPFPSPADGFYLAGYPLLVAGLAVAIARQGRVRDRRAAIDAAIIAVSLGLVAWVYIVEPALAADFSPFETLVTAAYPLADVLVLAMAVRFVIGTRWNVPALRLLLLGLAFTLVGDFAFEGNVLQSGEDTRFVNTTLLLGIVLIGVGGFHRTMTTLTEPSEEPSARTSTGRIVLLGAVCLVPPAVLLIQAVRGEDLYARDVFVAMVLLFALVVARYADILTRTYRAADRDALLSRFGAELLASSGKEELLALARRTARELAGDGSADLVRPDPDADRASSAFVAPVEVQGHRVAELVAEGVSTQAHHSLTTVATQLSLALERERLLATERASAATLADRNERLRELDRMKDQFVSTVSHELRTPLTSMIGYLELVLDREAGELTEEQQRFLEIVNRNCDRLNRLIDDILFVARVDAGRFAVEKQWTDVAEVAREALETMRAAAERKSLELRFSAPHELPQLWADPTRLTQLLDNLLSNAIKFTPEGGVVSLNLARHDDRVAIEVSDSGVGIPEGEAGRLFDRFFRASTGSSAPGTGLGLSIIKTIAEAHGGTVSVESHVGVGTTFTVDLPLQSQSEAAVEGVAEEVST